MVALSIFVPAAWSSASIAAEADGAAPAAATSSGQRAAQRFDILDFAIDGNSVLTPAAVEQAVYAFMGPDKTVDDVEAARQSLESAYQAAGYQTVLVVTPEQEVRDGVVALQVIEGRLERVKITESRYFSLEQISAAVPALKTGEVPRMPDVQKQLETVALQSRDREVTPILRAGSQPGLVEAELRVKDEVPLHGSLEINNHNSSNTSPTRVLASLRYDNLWQRFHSFSLQYQTAPEDRAVDVWSGTYVMPVFDDSWHLAAYAAKFDSQSSVASAGAIAVIGTGKIYGARLVKQLEPIAGYAQSISFGADYKDFQQSIALVGADDQSTPISYLPFALRYDGGWSESDGSFTSFSFGPNFSIRGVGNSQREFEDKRFLARSNYLYVVANAEHTRIFTDDFRLLGRLSGQLSDSPLISNEQFAVGGADTVRGYHESEVLGDQGLFASLELQSPLLLSSRWPLFDGLRLVTFIDGARVWIKEALPGTESRTDISSAGLGIRFAGFQHVEGTFDWAYPLVSAGTVDAGAARALFKLSAEF